MADHYAVAPLADHGPVYVIYHNDLAIDVAFFKLGAKIAVWKHVRGLHTNSCIHPRTGLDPRRPYESEPERRW